MPDPISLEQLAKHLNAELLGEPSQLVDAVASFEAAAVNQVTFISDRKYLAKAANCSAGAIIIKPDHADSVSGNRLLMNNPYLGFALASQLFGDGQQYPRGIHPTAQIADSAVIGANSSIAANVVIGERVQIGDNARIGSGCSVGADSKIGADCLIYPNVSIYHDVQIGERFIAHSGSVIGSDGFGFANDAGRWSKILQTGGVRIGDDVEFGATCTIDRGALEDTVIGDGVKFDNQIHVAHNVVLGNHVAIAGCSGIAGSTKVGDYTTLSGRVSVLGHLEIPAKSHITAGTVVSRTIKEAGAYSGGTDFQDNRTWRKNVSRFKQLDEMSRRIRQLEKTVEALSKTNGTAEPGDES